ncbi:MAG: redoxin domain-containing protein [Bacteroidota bacterium]|nr:redoxin domain-containing protein [Bacteroidota bacterium]
MRRGIVIAASIVLMVAAIAFILVEFQKKQHNYEKYKTIPVFSFETIFNKIKSTSSLPKHEGYVILIFSPGCEACQMEASDYSKHIESMQNIFFLMVSTDSLSKIGDFALKQQLYNADNFQFGHVDANEFETHFGSVPIPSIFIYNSEKELISKTRVANSLTLLKYFKNELTDW